MRGASMGVLVGSMVSLAATSPAWATDYSQPGPLAVTTGALGSTEGGSTGGYVVVPQGSGPYPLIIASHGWSASADQQVGWAQQFASYGFVVVAPSFPSPLSPNEQTDSTIIETLVTLYSDPTHASPAQGKVDAAHVGLEGHSAGGLATTLASAAIHPTATVLFDPVDSNGDGQKALPSICNPLLGVFADPSSCNNQEGWWPYANTTAGDEVLFHVVGSTHCDGENLSRSLCASFCGGAASTTRQAEYARYATAFFLAHLAGDAAAAATLGIGALSADTGVTSVIVKPGVGCGVGAGSDGGAAAGDAGSGGSGSAGAVPDASSADARSGGGSSSDGAESGADDAGVSTTPAAGDTSNTGTPSSSSGCACRTAPARGEEWGWLALAT
ncbi:MAG TPA: hypothetical protein VIF09_27155, partial [Polyangiaceae bacterium]